MIESRSTASTFALAVVAALTLSTNANAAPPPFTPVVHGDAFVRVTDEGDFAAAADGAKLAPGNSMKTPPSGAAVMTTPDGVSMRLGPGSALSVKAAIWLPPEHPGAHPLRSFQASLSSGDIDIDVHDPQGNAGALLTLPGGDTLGIWHGAANVSIHDGNVTLAIYEGVAIIGAGTKWKSLTGGMALSLEKKSEIAMHPIPAATTWDPTSRDSRAFALVRDDDHAALGLAWTAVPGATTYRLEMARDKSMRGDLTVTDTPKTSFTTEPLGPGAYYARVRTVSGDGVLGLASPVTGLRVARVTLPPNASAARDGVIVLPAAAYLKVDDATDLEIATVVEGAKSADLLWAPAPDTINLSGAPRRALRMRYSAAKGIDTPITLVRRELEAKVTLSPRPAKWPKDPIDITVKLSDKSGYVDTSKETINADVRIDIDKVDVQWKHSGDTWTGRLSPRTKGDGPWVVRVYVRDRGGAEIGAGLLDVDGPKGPPHGDDAQPVVYQQAQ